MKIFDFYFKFLKCLGIFGSKHCKTVFDTYLSLIYSIFVRIFSHLLFGCQIAHLAFNQLTFEEFVETLMYTIAIANNIIKGLIITIKQNKLEELKKSTDLFTSRLQSKEEKNLHKRYCNFIRLRNLNSEILPIID